MMGDERKRAWAEIDLDALKYNYDNIRARLLPQTKLMCVVKADAYGHGAPEVAKALLGYGADAFAVATANEALLLRSAVDSEILILGQLESAYLKELVASDITMTVFDYELAKMISKEAKRQNKCAKIHIKIDTGMTRIGFLPTDASVDEIVKISKLDAIEIEGMFSHFSKADEADKSYAVSQLNAFLSFNEKLKENGVNIAVLHIANSAGIIDMPNSHLNMVRAGIILYGYYPSDCVNKEAIKLKSVMSVKASISRAITIEEETIVGYGGTYRAKKGMKIATVPIGYADGYTRLFSEKAKMIAGEKLVSVVGRICMDQCMIDITCVNNISAGDTVIIMGREGDTKIDASYLADIMGTISYEILCMFGQRVLKVYLKDGKTKKVLSAF